MPAPVISNVNSTNAPTFKHLNFFSVAPVKDIHDLASSPEAFKNPSEISVIASSSFGALLADIYGSVHVLNKDFESVLSWVAFPGGRVTHMIASKGTLLTVGEGENSSTPLLKIWEIELDEKGTPPHLIRNTKIQHGARPYPISSIALTSTLSHLAVGLADGTVLLFRHLDQSLSSSSSLTALPKARTLLESPTEPVTGLGFREKCSDTEDIQHLHLFVTTTNRVLSFQVSGRGSGSGPRTVDDVGANLNCAVVDWHRRDLIVARDEAIYMYGADGRGPSLAYEGYKSYIHTHLNYVVIVSPPTAPSAASASATVRNYVARQNQDSGRTDVSKVTVFDIENKFIAYSGVFANGVRTVFSEWGNIYILTNGGELTCFEEKSTPAKLDLLYGKNLYNLALSVAHTQQLDPSSVADIHRQYGDHLYTKGDYDGSMQQYVRTIGYLQPSYVIRRFLDAQRIHNLVTYLQDLHQLGLANSEHTTLLLNTYTKLKDVARLDSFIKTESRIAADGSDVAQDEPPFDLETAIRVCRQAGYYNHASYLAKKYKRHEDYLRIQVEDAGSYKEALLYVRRLDREATESNLARYGRVLLANLPDETTQLFIDICTGTRPLAVESEDIAATKKASNAAASYLSYLALTRAQPAAAEAAPATPSTPTAKTLDDALPRKTASMQDISQTGTPIPGAIEVKPPPEQFPSPRKYFSHFVDNMEKFVLFLESVALQRWGQSVEDVVPPHSDSLPTAADPESDRSDQEAVWQTLLELYLTLSEKEGKDGPLKRKALNLLKSDTIPYDTMHALMLCTTRDFTPGLVLLWEKLGMIEEIVRFWISQEEDEHVENASTEVLKTLRRYGPDNHHLYPVVLRFMTSNAERLSRHSHELEEMLETIEEEKIMPPLAVIQVLSRNEVTSVGLLKNWLLLRIQNSRKETETDEELISSYRNETTSKLKQVADLSNLDDARIFHVTRCAQCSAQLDLPAVHFMCNHSFHQRCLPDNIESAAMECTVCAREHGMLREIRRNNARLASQHDVFATEVREGGFSALAAGFGRGLMRSGRAEEVSASS